MSTPVHWKVQEDGYPETNVPAKSVSDKTKNEIKEIFNKRVPSNKDLCQIIEISQPMYKPEKALKMEPVKQAIKWRVNGL